MKNKKTHIWIALGIIAVFLFIAFFGCGSDIKGIRDMRFGIDIKGGVEAVFEPVGITKKPTPRNWKLPEISWKDGWMPKISWTGK